MPTSDKQLAANRANAAKSTGPRTPEGKARSARNARTHGFTASTFTVVRLEDLDEIARLKHDAVAVYKPVNSQELFALEQMAISQQTILRAARLEAGLFTACLQTALDDNDIPFSPMSPALAGDGDIEITRAQNRNYALGSGFHGMAKQANSITLMLRRRGRIRPSQSPAARITKRSHFGPPTRRKRAGLHPTRRTRFDRRGRAGNPAGEPASWRASHLAQKPARRSNYSYSHREENRHNTPPAPRSSSWLHPGGNLRRAKAERGRRHLSRGVPCMTSES